MKYSLKKFFSFIFLLLVLFLPSYNCSFSTNSSESSPSSSKSLDESNLAPSDWKIVIDSNDNKGDFSFIQSNKVAGIFNDSDSLLIYGTVFLAIGTIGLITVFVIIIKNRKKLNSQKASNKQQINSQKTQGKNKHTKYKH